MARESQVYSYNLERLSQAHREGEYCGVRGGVETLIPVEMERPEGRLEPEKKVLGLAWDRGNTTKVSYVSMEVETCS